MVLIWPRIGWSRFLLRLILLLLPWYRRSLSQWDCYDLFLGGLLPTLYSFTYLLRCPAQMSSSILSLWATHSSMVRPKFWCYWQCFFPSALLGVGFFLTGGRSSVLRASSMILALGALKGVYWLNLGTWCRSLGRGPAPFSPLSNGFLPFFLSPTVGPTSSIPCTLRSLHPSGHCLSNGLGSRRPNVERTVLLVRPHALLGVRRFRPHVSSISPSTELTMGAKCFGI